MWEEKLLLVGHPYAAASGAERQEVTAGGVAQLLTKVHGAVSWVSLFCSENNAKHVKSYNII